MEEKAMNEEEKIRDERGLLPDDVLDQIGAGNRRLLLYMCGAATCWGLGAMPLMASSFTSDTNNATMITLVEEFNLTNDRAYLADLPTSAYMAGNMIGGTFLTTASDRWGRRPILIYTLILFWVFGLLASMSPSILVYGLLRACQGCFYTGSTITAWVAGYEMTPRKLRPLTTLLFGISWVIGYSLVAPLSYLSSSWRSLLIFTSLPTIPFSIWAFFSYPETLHYLASRSKTEQIEEWLQKISNVEKSKIRAEQICGQIKKEKVNIWKEMWYHKIFLLYSVVMIYLWVCDTFTYFGLSLYSTQLSGDKYVNYLMMGIVELPIYIFTPSLLDRFGRRTLVSGSHLVAGLAFLSLLMKPGDSVTLAIWLIGKSAITLSFMALFVYASEVFPTNIRNASVGMCAVIARLGGIAAPQIKNMGLIFPSLPEIVLSVVCLTAAILTLILPETVKKALPSSISESVSQESQSEKSKLEKPLLP
ncbi:unnamed protein product, partial [Mesorhabditis belari]|uniref:Major facilitator superfamily (MFS) profile domain-containing protein n=1 Tax=Mesorhabditis belari TaxID=2138241 RepID=A0AAF3EPU8_9BILA